MFSRSKSAARFNRKRGNSRSQLSQFVSVLEQRTLLTSPANLSTDIPWDDDPGTAGNQTDYASSADVVAAFNNGRRKEESQLGLAANSLGNVSLPGNWDSLSAEDKGLHLVNSERTVRAGAQAGVIGLPLAGIEGNIQQLAQDYTNYLVSTDQWTHNPTGGQFGGTDPFSRLDQHSAIGTGSGANGCHEFLPYAENLSIFFSTDAVALPVERAIYNWIYADQQSSSVHRQAIFVQDEALNGQTGYENNYGATNSEGFMGLAIAGRTDGSFDPFNTGFANQTMVTMLVFDPVADPACDYDDGSPENVELSVSTSSATEAGQTVVTITATTGGNVSGNQTADIAITGTGISTEDYATSGTTITIADGQKTGSVQLTVQNDSLVEATETLSVTLRNLSSGILAGTTTSADLTITDNDTATFSINDVSESEDAGTITFSVSVDQPVDIETQLEVTFADGSATAGDDYEATSKTVTFAAGSTTSQPVIVNLVNDVAVESAETFIASLTVTTAAGDRQFNVSDTGTATITNDDLPPGITVTETDAGTIVGEIGNTDSISVSLATQPTSNVVLDITAGNTAEATANPTELTFSPSNWDSPQQVVISGVDDSTSDANQVSTITISVNAASSDDAYDAVADSAVQVTTIDTTGKAYLDIDGDAKAMTLTDGILVLRHAAGFTGEGLINGVVSPTGTRPGAAEITTWLNEAGLVMLDVDADGKIGSLTDGILVLRYLAGFNGEALTSGAVSGLGSRTTPEAISEFLAKFTGSAAGTAAPVAGPVFQSGNNNSGSTQALVANGSPTMQSKEYQLPDDRSTAAAFTSLNQDDQATTPRVPAAGSTSRFTPDSSPSDLFELDSVFDPKIFQLSSPW